MNITNEISILRGLTAGDSLANVNLDIIEQKFDEVGLSNGHWAKAVVQVPVDINNDARDMFNPYPDDEVPPNGH